MVDPAEKATRKITILLAPSELVRLDALARADGRSRSSMARRIISLALGLVDAAPRP